MRQRTVSAASRGHKRRATAAPLQGGPRLRVFRRRVPSLRSASANSLGSFGAGTMPARRQRSVTREARNADRWAPGAKRGGFTPHVSCADDTHPTRMARCRDR